MDVDPDEPLHPLTSDAEPAAHSIDDVDSPYPSPSTATLRRRRRKAPEQRGYFHKDHKQEKTHMCRVREEPVVLVLLGPTIPRPDRGEVEREKWARAMLILFKPWRNLVDLKRPEETWSVSFDATVFSSKALQLMKNIDVENECKDARDEYEKLRR
ncbi:hypothetical protein C8J57DRAFT_1099114, partial [Mycena rebaudengoi]